MKYPAILRNLKYTNQVVMAFEQSTVIHMEGGSIGKFTTAYQIKNTENITREYLSNTWGVVESKEHAEFIIELCKANNLSVYKCSHPVKKDIFSVNKHGTLFFHEDNGLPLRNELKQITIPLPPKSVKSEWPQVGDEAEVRHDSGQVLKGELLAITSEYAIIQQLGHEQHLYLSAWKFSKPKTPEEELRDKSSDIPQNEKRNKSKQAYEILKSLDYDYDLVKQKWFKKEYI